MTSPNSDHPQVTTRQRTVLLATDRSQSIIAEVTDGKHNNIAYCVYGEQSAHQPIATALGFNGQLRERSLGWYFLGNGYRAYNPILMRFHSQDGWSPFGRGGLNAYMYCVGDPVNRVDPTGHVPWFHPRLTRWAKNTFNFFFDPDRTGVHKTTQRQAISERLLGGLQPETTGEGKALFAAGGAMAERAPAPKPQGYPGGDPAPNLTRGWEPPTSSTEWVVSRTAQARSSSTSHAPAAGGLRASIGAGLPPSYEQATQLPMKLSTVNTLTASMAPQHFQVYLTATPRPTHGLPPPQPLPRPQPQFNIRQATHAPVGPMNPRTLINRGAATPAQTQRNLRRLGRL